MAEAAQSHTGGGVARRVAFHERQRAERAELEARGGLHVPAEDGLHAHDMSAVDVLAGVAEAGPNYIVLKKTETKMERRKRKRDELVQEQSVIDAGVAPVAVDHDEGAPALQVAKRAAGCARVALPVARSQVRGNEIPKAGCEP